MITEELDYFTETDTFAPDWLGMPDEDRDFEPTECWELDEFRDQLRTGGGLRPETWH